MTTNTAKSPYTSEQTQAWLRGLLTIAWADGDFDSEERDIIASLADGQLASLSVELAFKPIAPDELATVLGKGTPAAENFLRTAVMVALADGIYSFCEDELLYQFCQALGLQQTILEALRHTLEDTSDRQTEAVAPSQGLSTLHPGHHPPMDVLHPVKHWLDGWEVHDPKVAHFICKMIPPQCPFERDIKLFGRKIVHIPPMCKLNPLYDQLVGLRFRALSYLADECKEDVTQYC